MTENIIETQTLENGLTLEVLDESRKIAGDRYHIKVSIRIGMDVDEKWFSQNEAPVPFPELREKLGRTVQFMQAHERNFVDEKDKEPIIKGILERIGKERLRYFSHPDFARKFIVRQYKELPEVKYGAAYKG